MSKYFNWPASLKRLVRFDAARAEDVNGALDELTAGLDTLDTDVDRAIKLPSGASDQTLSLSSGQRANLLLAFDASGDITAVAGGGRYRGDWLTATAYVVSDYFRDPASKNIYSTLASHTSGVLATDIAAGKVQLVIDVADVELAKAAAEAAALAAAGQVTLAAGQVTLAAGQVSLATTQAGVATTQAGIATTAAGTATTQAGIATTQAGLAGASYTNFDKRYLGAKASDPALDNQGAALTAGALYFNTSVNEMRSWNGSAWEAAYLPASGYVTEAPSDGNRYARKNTGWEMTGVVQRSARTSNTELSAADGGKRIDITSGTFTQTFAAATTLGDGWWCYLGNSGTGDITLTPSGAETIDGLASFVMYPGEVRLVQCDGVALRSIVLNPFYKRFTASGSFVKAPGYQLFEGVVIGGGGGGGKDAATSGGQAYGGAGGSAHPFRLPPSAFAATSAFTIGAGGSGATAVYTPAGDGGNSTLTLIGLTFTGGGGGGGNSGYSGASSTGPAIDAVTNIYRGGGNPSGGATSSSHFGGGRGGMSGGAPGCSYGSGGNGGTYGSAGNGGAGVQPGGGGGAGANAYNGGPGAAGGLDIWGIL